MTRIDDPQRTLDLLLMREVLKTANLFGDASGHAGLARDNFVDVIAEAVVNASHPTAHRAAPTAAPVAAHHDHPHAHADELLGTVVDGPARISSPFGARTDPITGKHSTHHGVDIAAPLGSPITSVSSGTVTRAGENGGYGLVVEVEADDGTVTRYAHANSIGVNVGDRVHVGDEIATVGSTGRSTGPHLHLEVRRAGVAVDPTTALLAAGSARPRS